MTRTTIEWTDETWNPVTGCTKVSRGCKNCYAETIANRKLPRGGFTDRPFTTVRCHHERLDQPLRMRKPLRIFVNSMSDLFHEDVPFSFIDKVFAIAELANTHKFQILTKRPARMRQYFHESRKCWWPLPNVWLGVSVEDQATADERIPLLLQTPAAVRFVSYEPALGRIDLSEHLGMWWNQTMNCFEAVGHQFNRRGRDGIAKPGLDWLIAGGESGPNARPAHPDWFRSIRDQCAAAGVAFFFKQWGEWAPRVDRDRDDPDWRAEYTLTERQPHRYRILNLAGGYGFNGERVHMMARSGKRLAGRLLDGREHSEFPSA